MATTTKKKKSPLQEAVRNARQVTWVLKGHLKNAQIAYIRVGVGLAKVRDAKLYEVLHHPDMEDYAARRLNLGKTSLYRYLKVHDWIAVHHREWLEPRPKGFIPDLADVADLIWIEKELEKKISSGEKKAALNELREKALDGSLRKGELGRVRKTGRKPAEDGLRKFLAKLRLLRRIGKGLKSMPPEVISEMDSAIEILEHAVSVQKLSMVFDGSRPVMVRKHLGASALS